MCRTSAASLTHLDIGGIDDFYIASETVQQLNLLKNLVWLRFSEGTWGTGELQRRRPYDWHPSKLPTLSLLHLRELQIRSALGDANFPGGGQGYTHSQFGLAAQARLPRLSILRVTASSMRNAQARCGILTRLGKRLTELEVYTDHSAPLPDIHAVAPNLQRLVWRVCYRARNKNIGELRLHYLLPNLRWVNLDVESVDEGDRQLAVARLVHPASIIKGEGYVITYSRNGRPVDKRGRIILSAI